MTSKTNILTRRPSIIITLLKDPSDKNLEESLLAIPSNKEALMVVWSQLSGKGREYIKRQVGFLARKQNSFFCESHISDSWEESGIEILVSNLWVLNSQKEDSRYSEVLQRYLFAHHNIQHIQRLFTRNSVLRLKPPSQISKCTCKGCNCGCCPRDDYENIPSSLIDFKVPSNLYQQISNVSRDQMQLWHKLSSDYKWQSAQIKDLVKDDEFLRNLNSISLSVNSNPNKQPKGRLVLCRNDYMIDQIDNVPKQVEVNLMAASLGMLSEGVRKTHQVLNQLTGQPKGEPVELNDMARFAEAIKSAHSLYRRKDTEKEAVVVIVSERETTNVIDMEGFVSPLAELGVTTRVYLFSDIPKLSEFDEETGVFTIQGEEVSVFYLRVGYNPEHYTDTLWECRRQMEASRALVCPDVNQQITNLKYFQYLMNQKDTWLHFGFEENKFEESNKTFAKIYTFDRDFKLDKEKLLAFINSNGGLDKYVLKPCREGGANNFFGDEIKQFVDETPVKELCSYILMERIFPREKLGLWTDFKSINVAPIISEIGFYCSGLWDSEDNLKYESYGDYLVRSKKSSTNEGGICSGFAFLDTFSLE